MRIVLIATLLALSTAAAAQENWVLTTADFRASTVGLKAIEPGGVRVHDPVQNADRVVPMEEFLQLERPAAANASGPAPALQQGKFILHLAGGDRLAGEPLAVRGEQLAWASVAAGEVLVPMSRVAAMTRPGQQPPDQGQAEDVVTLANGDQVRGIIAGIEGGKVSVQRPDADEPLAVPVDSITRISFAATAAPAPAGGTAAPSFRLRLADGSSLPARGVTLAGGKLSADLGDGKPRPMDLARIAAIEQVNGPAAWLSALPPSENVYTPFFGTGQAYAARMDAAVDGSRDLRFGAKTFRRAIGVHAYSKLTWPLDGRHAAFRTQYAVDERLPHADMAVRVLLDGKPVHEATGVRAGTLSKVITVDLGSAKSLTLEVAYGSGTDVQDRLVWLEPALLKKKPAEEPAPAAPATAPAPEPAPPTPAPTATPTAPQG